MRFAVQVLRLHFSLSALGFSCVQCSRLILFQGKIDYWTLILLNTGNSPITAIVMFIYVTQQPWFEVLIILIEGFYFNLNLQIRVLSESTVISLTSLLILSLPFIMWEKNCYWWSFSCLCCFKTQGSCSLPV